MQTQESQLSAALTPLEACELAYSEHPNSATEKAWLDARKAEDLALAKARGLAHKASVDAQRAREKQIVAQRKRLAEVIKLANGLANELEPHAIWWAATHVAAVRRVEIMLAAIDAQNRAVREANRLAAALGVTIEIAGEGHEGNARGAVGRAQNAALRGIGARAVTDYFRATE
jgi:hypothetical protein